ncbi:hypothetical protein [Streptomyces sp. NPDC001348]
MPMRRTVGRLERWGEEADIDGFNLVYATTPGTSVDLVVPELRARRQPPGQGRAPGRPPSRTRHPGL